MTTKYVFRHEKLPKIKSKYKFKKLANDCGITVQYLSEIVNNKSSCKKPVAFILTKSLNENKSIEDYFIEISDSII